MKVKIVGEGMDREVILTTKSGVSFRISQGNENGIHVIPIDNEQRPNAYTYVHGQKSIESKDGKEFTNTTMISIYGRPMPYNYRGV